jgi:hypothetical protein
MSIKKRRWLKVVEILFSWEMDKIFGIRKKIMSVFSLLGFSPSPSFNNSYIRVRLIGARSNILKNTFAKRKIC